MHFGAQNILAVVSLFFATLGHAIFADEAYQVDYHHALLGVPQPRTTFFHRPSIASKASLLYTLSNRLVLGAVNPKDGSIIWRQQLVDRAQNETVPGFMKAGEGGKTLVTAIGETVESWDATDGRLTWQWKGNGTIKSLETTERGNDVIVLSEATDTLVIVRKISTETGAVLWEHRDTRSVNLCKTVLRRTCRADKF